MTESTQLADNPPPWGEKVEFFARRLERLFGEKLLSLALFGEEALEDESTRRPCRSVLVLGSIDLGELRELSREGARLGRQGLTAPLAMTPAFIHASRDTFPLELLEIQLAHVAVRGDDFFAPLEFDPAHVRLQCERELKAILMGLHQGLLTSAGSERLLGPLESNLAESLLRVLRGLLFLRGERRPLGTHALVEAAEGLTGRALPGITTALDQADMALWHKFQVLYADVQTLGHYADAF